MMELPDRGVEAMRSAVRARQQLNWAYRVILALCLFVTVWMVLRDESRERASIQLREKYQVPDLSGQLGSGDGTPRALRPGDGAMNIVRGNIVDFAPTGGRSAIVNAANVTLLGGGGVDGAIHRAAGPALARWCESRPYWDERNFPGVRCPIGDVRSTRAAGALRVDHILHAVGPLWPSALRPPMIGEYVCKTDEEARGLLTRCLNAVFEHAIHLGVDQLAIPAISCGIFGGKVPVFAEVLREVMAAVEGEGHTLPEVTVYLFLMEEFDAFVKVARNWPPETCREAWIAAELNAAECREVARSKEPS